MEYYAAFNREETLNTLTITWTSTEDQILWEIWQSHKDKCCMVPLTLSP